jgi:predicted signal transduction protein with EAL and GGDEF domain
MSALPLSLALSPELASSVLNRRHEEVEPNGRFSWFPGSGEVQASEAFMRLIGWTEAGGGLRMRADTLLAGLSVRDRRQLRVGLGRLITGRSGRRLEINLWTPSIGHRRLRIDLQQVHQLPTEGPVVIGQLIDVTPQGLASAHLYRLTRYDSLTALPNRQWLLEALRERAGSRLARTGLALLAIDRYQEIAQAYGHRSAEQVVIETARRLQALVQPPVPPAAVAAHVACGARIAAAVHLGRDEFALLLEDLELPDQALAACRRVMTAFGEPLMVQGRELFLRCSIGIEGAPTGPEHGDAQHEALAWIGRAEAARRAATRAGGNRVRLFQRRPTEDWAERLRIERDLQHALTRGELALYLQPKVHAPSGRTVGFEALMRWVRRGVQLPPSRFIPLAEEMGLIVPLGEWAIRQACASLARLREAGRPDCTLAVNLSARQLGGSRLGAVVAEALSSHSVPANRLELELTESVLMQDPERAIRDLQSIRDLGVGLALDDFGTGYSSLAYLTRLPLSALKIDRTFVQGLDASERNHAVAAAVMTLGANLNLQVVAEGVEREAQRRELLQMGCTLQQGFLYGQAVPLEQALDRLASDSGGCGPAPRP